MAALVPQSPYTTLYIPRDATLSQIRSAYRKLILSCHPDKVQHESASVKKQDQEQFYQVQQAYEILSDENRRQRYDQEAKLAELKAEMVERRGSFSPYRPYEYRSPRTESTSKVEYETREPTGSRYNKPNVFAATYAEARPSTSRKYTDVRYTKSSRKTSASGGTQEEKKMSRAYDYKEDYGRKRMEDEREWYERNAERIAEEMQRDRRARRRDQNTRKDMETKSRGKFVAPAISHPGESLHQFPTKTIINKLLAQPAAVAKPFASSYSEASPRSNPSATLLKLKQGLVGFVNGANIAAMADTGSRENIISESYAKNLGLNVEGSPSSFKIGNAQKIQSLGEYIPITIHRESFRVLMLFRPAGTVSLLWAFAENPKESFSILCHVLPRCTYSLILGNRFLRATETISKFGHRLTKCLFSVVNNVSRFGFLGESCQRLEGTIADKHQVFAIPDTGAERNVMSLQYAIEYGLELKLEPENCGYLQFADGTYEKTLGQVETFWTFESGERIPITFEILRYCCSDVIIGEDILTEHKVFQAHAASISSNMAFEDDSFELAPFDFVNSWQRGCERLFEKVNSKKDPSCHKAPPMDPLVEERRRRSVWNHEYDFGASATTGEKELELARRERFSSNLHSGELPSDDTQSSSSGGAHQRWGLSAPEQIMPVVPTIPTSQTRR